VTRRDCQVVLGGGLCAASTESLLSRWRSIAAESDGVVGVAALNLRTGEHDVGVIDGKLAIAVYIKGSKQSQPAREKIIARPAQAAFTAQSTG